MYYIYLSISVVHCIGLGVNFEQSECFFLIVCTVSAMHNVAKIL